MILFQCGSSNVHVFASYKILILALEQHSDFWLCFASFILLHIRVRLFNFYGGERGDFFKKNSGRNFPEKKKLSRIG